MDKTSDDQFPPGRNAPEDLVAETRGMEFDAGDKDIGRKIADRLAALRDGYVITYVPKGVAAVKGWHRVTVRVPGRRVTVRARAGYYAAPNPKELGSALDEDADHARPSAGQAGLPGRPPG